MKTRFDASEHWTDDELIQHLYAVGPEGPRGAHIDRCEECRTRLLAMQSSRNFVEEQHQPEAGLSIEALVAQRRAIYEKLDRPRSWRVMIPLRRWAAAACTVAVLSGGFLAWEYKADWERQTQAAQRAKVSDAQLADDVSRVASNSEPDAAAPLQALFQN